MISLEEAESIVKSEAYRAGRWAGEYQDRIQSCWVILLEQKPQDPALAVTILRRRLQNIKRYRRTRKRGHGAAIGRLDAGWDEQIGEDPTPDLEQRLSQEQVVRALNFKVSGSRQAQHQSIARAKKRWEKIKRPYD
jgi:hypothetical protein